MMTSSLNAKRFAGKPLKQPMYEFDSIEKCNRDLAGSSLYEVTNREDFVEATAEMVLLCKEAIRRSNRKIAKKTSKPLSLEYIADRLDIDDPLWGFFVRDTASKLQGFITCTTFTNWQKTFRWDSMHDNAFAYDEPELAHQMNTGERKYDASGSLAAALQATVRCGDPWNEGIVWPRIAEISLLGGIGCGKALLGLTIERLEALKANSQHNYDYVVLQATENSIPFYESMGFVRVGALTEDENFRTLAKPPPKKSDTSGNKSSGSSGSETETVASKPQSSGSETETDVSTNAPVASSKPAAPSKPVSLGRLKRDLADNDTGDLPPIMVELAQIMESQPLQDRSTRLSWDWDYIDSRASKALAAHIKERKRRPGFRKNTGDHLVGRKIWPEFKSYREVVRRHLYGTDVVLPGTAGHKASLKASSSTESEDSSPPLPHVQQIYDELGDYGLSPLLLELARVMESQPLSDRPKVPKWDWPYIEQCCSKELLIYIRQKRAHPKFKRSTCDILIGRQNWKTFKQYREKLRNRLYADKKQAAKESSPVVEREDDSPSTVATEIVSSPVNTYIVEIAGESPAEIAKKCNVSVWDIIFLNQGIYKDMNSRSRLMAGTKLFIPSDTDIKADAETVATSKHDVGDGSGAPKWYVAEENDTPKMIAKEFGVSCGDIISANIDRLPELQPVSRLREGTRVRVSHFHLHDDQHVPYCHWTFPDDKFEHGEPSYMMALKLNRKGNADVAKKPVESSLAVKVDKNVRPPESMFHKLPTVIPKTPTQTKKKPAAAAPVISPPGKPKRPMTGYLLYCEAHRFKPQYDGLKATERIKRLSALWNSLTDKQKAPFQRKADALKANFDKAKEKWERDLSRFFEKHPELKPKAKHEAESPSTGESTLFNKVVTLKGDSLGDSHKEFKYFYVLTYIPDLQWCHLAPMRQVGWWGEEKPRCEGRPKWMLVDESECKEVDASAFLCEPVRSRGVRGTVDADSEEWDIFESGPARKFPTHTSFKVTIVSDGSKLPGTAIADVARSSKFIKKRRRSSSDASSAAKKMKLNVDDAKKRPRGRPRKRPLIDDVQPQSKKLKMAAKKKVPLPPKTLMQLPPLLLELAQVMETQPAGESLRQWDWDWVEPRCSKELLAYINSKKGHSQFKRAACDVIVGRLLFPTFRVYRTMCRKSFEAGVDIMKNPPPFHCNGKIASLPQTGSRKGGAIKAATANMVAGSSLVGDSSPALTTSSSRRAGIERPRRTSAPLSYAESPSSSRKSNILRKPPMPPKFVQGIATSPIKPKPAKVSYVGERPLTRASPSGSSPDRVRGVFRDLPRRKAAPIAEGIFSEKRRKESPSNIQSPQRTPQGRNISPDARERLFVNRPPLKPLTPRRSTPSRKAAPRISGSSPKLEIGSPLRRRLVA